MVFIFRIEIENYFPLDPCGLPWQEDLDTNVNKRTKISNNKSSNTE